MYRHSRSSLAPWYARAQMPAGKEKPPSLSSDSSSLLKFLLTEIETPIKKTASRAAPDPVVEL